MDGAVGARVRELVMHASGRAHDPQTLREEIVTTLRRAVPFDAWCFGYADPGTGLPSSGTGDNPAIAADLRRFIAIEYADTPGAQRRSLSDLSGGPGPALSVLSQATGGDLHASPQWRELYEPYDIGDELRMALVADGHCWGYLELMRHRDRRSFTGSEARFMTRLGPPMGRALRAALTWTGPTAGSTAHGTHLQPGPGTLILNDDSVPTASTAEAEHWLAELGQPQTAVGAALPLPVGVLAVAAKMRSAPDRPGATAAAAARVRTRLRTGRWLTIHASRLTNMTASTGTVAVTLQPAHPADISPLLFHAHGLTPRERQLARLLLHGLPNAHIAHQLNISVHTVGDHVKAVLDKLHVHSKHELLASVLGQPQQGIPPTPHPRNPSRSSQANRQGLRPGSPGQGQRKAASPCGVPRPLGAS